MGRLFGRSGNSRLPEKANSYPFVEHIKPRLDPARIIAAGIQGAQGVQRVNQVNGLEVRLGPIVFDNLQVNEFSMSALNSATGRYAAGLLGNPLLWPYRSHYDFKNGRLILERYEESRDGLVPSLCLFVRYFSNQAIR